MSLQWTESATESEFDRFAPSYDELLRDPLRSGFASDPLHFSRRKWNVIERLLRNLGRRPEAMAWLDVGCGRGELLEIAGSHFADAAGCDPSVEMLSSVRCFPVRRQLHSCELPFSPHSFDFVTAVCVFHHVLGSDRQALTREIRRVLRPNGLFCLVEHNPCNPLTRRIVSRCPVDADAELLSLRTGMKLLTASGLRPRRSEYFLYLPESWFRTFRATEFVLRKVPLGGQYALMADVPTKQAGPRLAAIGNMI